MCLIFLILYLSQILIEINGQCPRDAKNCTECISYSGKCYWCIDEKFSTKDDPKDRCDTKQKLENNGCKKIEDYDTRDKTSSVKRNSPFSDSIQLKPQEFDIELRPGSETTIEISYKRAEDYPIDMYFLMDLSCTMRKHKDILVKISKSLSTELKKITKNFRLGFGSYVDKPIMPFSAFDLTVRNCDGSTIGSENTYSFFHRQSLTQNESAFADIVDKTQTSGNVDGPEGTLDALMQVMECNQQIGWRNDSNKIIVVITDAEFHYAGDGRLGGIVTPNDGKCHLVRADANGKQVWKYTHSEITDYPSMYQISEKAKNRYNIVFTVDKSVRNVYQKLEKIIGTNSLVADLSDDVTKTANLIQDIYKRISSNVELEIKQTPRKPEDVSVEFMVECDGRLIPGSSCTFNEIKEIKFKATIRLDACPEDKSLWKRTSFKIGLNNNEIEATINLKMLCGCDCDGRPEQNSEYCSKNGTLSCGKCVACNGKRYGLQCECDSDTISNQKDRDINCKKDSNSTVICSGRGKCVCNSCQCDSKAFKGKFCHLDESTCFPGGDTSDISKLCNGHGQCNNSAQCECFSGYKGTLCDCVESQKNCINVRNEKVCSGAGTCNCGKCECNPGYFGTTCQYCPLCGSELGKYCNLTLECVPEVCQLYFGVDNCTDRCSDLKLFHTFKQQIKPEKYIKPKDDITKGFYYRYYTCANQTADKLCLVEFELERIYDENQDTSQFQLMRNASKTCEFRLPAAVVPGSIVGGIILIGLAFLLIWKLLTEIWDRKEYARFQNELSKANWAQEENPVYKEPKSTFPNPMFALRDRAQKRLSRLTERISRRFDLNN